ncbi:hypothetical protein EDD85DRAFT_956101 [Armillaria nabsnona]|nr:hypothetical protein EDD85DRAFT_956101 [Armillaria nabsnona]
MVYGLDDAFVGGLWLFQRSRRPFRVLKVPKTRFMTKSELPFIIRENAPDCQAMAVETMAAKAGESDSIEQPLAATCILTLNFSLLTVTQEIQLRQLTVLRELENRESIYAPIRRLPRDILIEIFHSVRDAWWQDVAKEQLEDDHDPDSLDMTGTLWVLGRVCGLWRNMLHTSPASWARYVSVKSHFSECSLHILRAYLERTAEHPLNLTVICEDNYPSDGEIISFGPSRSAAEIELDVDDACHSDDYCSDIFLKAPQLWQASSSWHGIHQVMLPSGITHYSGPITCAEDLQLLSQLPKLQACRFYFNTQMSAASVDASVVMSELCQLNVDLGVLNFLTAPALRILTITTTDSQLELLPTITLFFRRSKCRLESFSMCSMLEKEPSALRNIFSSEGCPSISHLRLELSWVCHNVAEALTPSSILPNLRRLDLCFGFQSRRHTETERLALLDMICSRCEAGQLKTIEIQFNRGASRDIAADIRALIGDILEIRVEKWSSLYMDHWGLFSNWNLELRI